MDDTEYRAIIEGRIGAKEAEIVRTLEASGWNSTCDIYNRGWRKDVARMRRELKAAKAILKAAK